MPRDPRNALDDDVDMSWIGLLDFGNVIRHQHASLSPLPIRNVVRDDLPRLRLAIAAIRKDLQE
jgi:uncharacterized protein with HEPN domain